MPKKWTQETFVERIHSLNPNIEILSQISTCKSRVSCRCKTCGYTWSSVGSELLAGSGCRVCNYKRGLENRKGKTKRKTNEEFIALIKKTLPDIEVISEYKAQRFKVKCRCLIDGYEWEAYPQNLERGHAVVPLINNVEMNYTIGTVYSDFDGIIICDSNESYQTVADESIQTVTRRNPASIIEPLDSVYPYVIYNGNTNYDTGTVQGLFVEIDWDKKVFKTKSSFMLRDTVMHFLTNGQPKILKSFDGRIWMVDITGDPTATVQNHPDQVSISFNFTEIGDTYSTTDMYNNGLTDINREGS